MDLEAGALPNKPKTLQQERRGELCTLLPDQDLQVTMKWLASNGEGSRPIMGAVQVMGR